MRRAAGGPGLVMVPNWYGVNDDAIAKATMIAETDGAVVLLTDVYGEAIRPTSDEAARTAMSPLLADRATLRRRMADAMARLRAMAASGAAPVDPARLAAIGVLLRRRGGAGARPQRVGREGRRLVPRRARDARSERRAPDPRPRAGDERGRRRADVAGFRPVCRRDAAEPGALVVCGDRSRGALLHGAERVTGEAGCAATTRRPRRNPTG